MNMWAAVWERHPAEYCLVFSLSVYSYQGKTLLRLSLSVLHCHIQEDVPLAEPFVSCHLTGQVHIPQRINQMKDGNFYCSVAQFPTAPDSVSECTPGRVIWRRLGGPYFRLDSGWQGGIVIIIWGRKTLILVEYPEVAKVRAGAP